MTTNQRPGVYIRIALYIPVLLLVAGSVLLNPHLLERFVVFDHDVGSSLAFWAMYAASAMALTCAVGLTWSIRRRAALVEPYDAKQAAFRAAAVLLGALLALIGFEIGARTILPRERFLSASQGWEKRWYERHARLDGDVGVRTSLDESVDIYHPLLGWEPRPGYRSDTINIDRNGVRGNREYPTRKPEGTRRIVVIGDSFTFGSDVADSQSFPAIVESLLDSTEVINLAVHGYGTDQQYLRLREKGFPYEPDLVIIGVFLGDLRRNILTFRDYAKPRFFVSGDSLVLSLESLAEPARLLSRQYRPPLGQPYSVLLVRELISRVVSTTVFRHTRLEHYILSTRILDATLEQTRRHGAKFMLLILDWRLYTSNDPDEHFLEQWTLMRGVPSLNSRRVFLGSPQYSSEELVDGHYTPLGNRLIAEAICDEIVSRDLLPSFSLPGGGR